MKKITNTDHIVRIFTEESEDTCRVLLDVATATLRARTKSAERAPRRRRAAAEQPGLPQDGGQS